jgi:hypothetical protein
MTKENKILDSEIKEFKNYCVDFYHNKYGIYPIATEKEIYEAVNVFLMLTGIEKIQFDSFDREKVRYILNNEENFKL